ncbi:DUF6220 domain-containing protein [Neobacillus ginsengisoli]|uniref:CBS domain containing-hemolysin-like protein n=1 Tax=Neobacillus ginsengisoli TaxID=904295 RepID=A0ABT9XY02_9BACI|nr:DUF6220 domain-containing protein [Neobacillus ginsengisoli]MDQ0200351.1 CBS domain containing-hemolysin-like protein [Neobacillus ginsengisoli]
MKRILSNVHYFLSIVILICLVVEFFFAGMGVFHAASFKIHQLTGMLLLACSLLLLLVALFGKIGGKSIGLSTLLFVLLFIQPLLLQIHQPFVQALHLVNGLGIVATCVFLVRSGSMRGKERA